jgi:8-oxo-dGTP pyrophosphatase MutT (NUDIX family)
VDVIAVIKNSQGQATNVILVVQYRPALRAFSVEFPSGLIDGGEEPATAAIRELQEETGFSQKSGHKIKVISTSVPVAYEPGLTSSCSKAVVVEVSFFIFYFLLFSESVWSCPNESHS